MKHLPLLLASALSFASESNIKNTGGELAKTTIEESIKISPSLMHTEVTETINTDNEYYPISDDLRFISGEKNLNNFNSSFLVINKVDKKQLIKQASEFVCFYTSFVDIEKNGGVAVLAFEGKMKFSHSLKNCKEYTPISKPKKKAGKQSRD